MSSRLLLLLAAIALLLVPGAAVAQAQRAVAEARFDVNGDGTPDLIRIEQPPGVSVQLAGGGQAWKPFALSDGILVSGTIATGAGKRFGDRAVVVATAVFAPGSPRVPSPGQGPRRTAMILAWQAGSLAKLWEGELGARGQDGDYDGDYEVEVGITPVGLLRYQTRPDIVRCDGQPAYLYPEGFDFRTGRFRPVFNAPRMPANAPVLIAQQHTPPDLAAASSAGRRHMPGVAFRTSAASTQAGAEHAGQLVPPRELDDGNPATAWRESLGGNGRGEFITETTTMTDAWVAAVRITPGDASSEAMFRRANRLARAGLLIGTERAFWIEFPTDPARSGRFDQAYLVTLPEPVRAGCVTLIIDAVYPGTAARSADTGDTVIADLAVLTDLDLEPGGPETALVARVLAGGPEGMTATRLLAERGPAAVRALLDAARASGRTPEERLRLRRALVRLRDPASAAELVEGMAAASTPAADRQDFARALAVMGAEAIAPLAALVADAQGNEPARTAAAATLGRLPQTEARAALIAAAGSGSRAVRKAVVLSLSQRAPAELPELVAAAQAAQSEGAADREADLWRAIGLMARRAAPAARTAAAAAMAARLDSASGYELLYRLLAAAAHLDHAPTLTALQAALARLPADSAQSNALHRVTAAALTDNDSAQARALLLTMLSAADPGIRRSAAEALAEREDATADTDRALMVRLQSDTWPRIRLAAAAALGRRCGVQAEPAAALVTAVGADADIEVRRASLGALVACKAKGIGPRLLAVASDRKQPLMVRQRAITLIPILGDRALASGLVDLFAALRGKIWSDSQAVRLAAAAAVALGRLGHPSAVEPLLSAARDEAFPELQAAAVAGLGEMCPPAATPVFERLAQSGQRGVAIAARSARDHCRR